MLRPVINYVEPYDPGLFPEDLIERYCVKASEIVNLGSNENPYPPPSTVLEEISSALMEVNRYPHPSYRVLKGRLASYVGLDEGYVSVGAGASELLDSVCKAFLDPLDRVVVPIPTYTLYILLAMLREAELRFVDTEDLDFQLDPETLIEAVKDAKLAFIGSPNNPTGATVPLDLLDRLLGEMKGILVLDETYHEFAGISAAGLVEDHGNLIVIRSMSKYFSFAGLRIGYSISRPELAEAFERIRLPFSISRLAVKGALKALEELEYFKETRDRILSERDRLLRELKNFSFLRAYPSHANFILLRVLKKPFERSLTEFLAERGVIVRGLTGLLGLRRGEYIRVTAGKPEENSRFIEVCEEIEGLIQGDPR
ncbi:MAG: histidinol-phosphate transaminase [Candidatus Bathyarchaeia archaeon]